MGRWGTVRRKRNTFIRIFKTVANMQISKGLFHVKVNLRSFGRLQSKLLLTSAVRGANKGKNASR